MNFIQKTAIIIVLMLAAGLIYLQMNCHNTTADTVQIQSWNDFTRNSRNAFKKIGKAFTPASSGKNGAMCSTNANCDSGNCATGICQNKFVVGGPCNNNGQCKSGRCTDGTCRINQCAGLGGLCRHDKTCCSKRCIDGTCRRSHCKYGETSPGVCKLSPADTQTIIAASAVTLAIAAIIISGGAAGPALLPLTTTLIVGSGGIAGIQTSAELTKQNKARETKNAKLKTQVAQTKFQAEEIKLKAEKELEVIKNAEFKAEMEQLSAENDDLAAEIEAEKKQLAHESKQLTEQIEQLRNTIELLESRMNNFDVIAKDDKELNKIIKQSQQENQLEAELEEEDSVLNY